VRREGVDKVTPAASASASASTSFTSFPATSVIDGLVFGLVSERPPIDP
jgi:hypothetical protein